MSFANAVTWIGVDPGKNGGIAVIPPGPLSLAQASKMPDTPRDTYDLLADLATKWPDSRCIIERTHSTPQMGVRSAVSFGENRGLLIMGLVATKISFTEVTPAKWMRSLSCMTGGDKNITKRRSQEIFPHLRITHAIADSLLIAYFGRFTDASTNGT